MAILQLVDQMTDLLNEGREVPLSRYRMVDAEEFSQMLERMRISVPSSIRESERTLIERDNILAGARAEADKIIQEARDIASEMLGENSLVVMARQEANRLVEEGHEIARQRTGEADGYATQVLQELHEKLASISGQVENGIAMMTQQGEQYDDPQSNYNASNYSDSAYGSSDYRTSSYGESDGYSASGSRAVDGPTARRRVTTPLTSGPSTSTPSTSVPLTGRSSQEETSLGGWSQDSLPTGQPSRMDEFADRTEPFERGEFGTERFDGKAQDEGFTKDGVNDDGFNAGGFDNSRFGGGEFDDYSEFNDYVEPRREDNNSPKDKPLQAPTLNYLSDPSDSMSDHL